MSEHLPFTDAQLEALLQGRLAVREVKVDAIQRIVSVRALSDHEIDQGRLAAQAYCKSVRADIDLDPEFLEREKERQIVWRSIHDPDTGKPLFAAIEDVRKLDAALVRILFTAYLEVLDELNPLTTLSEEELKQLGEQLGKGREHPAPMLRLFDADTLRSLVRIMAARLSERA